MLFYSIEVLHIHITCLHVYIVYIYLHLLPTTPDCVMAEARITEFFGESPTREEVLDFMGLGSCMPREAWRLPSPQMLHQHRFHSVRPCRPALLAVGVAERRPRGGCLPPFRGASEVRRSLSPDCPPTGRAVGVRHPRAVGAGVGVWGPNTVPLACMPCGGGVPWGWLGAVPGGGGLPPL